MHGAGAAQDIHSLTPFLREKEKSDWVSKQKLASGCFPD